MRLYIFGLLVLWCSLDVSEGCNEALCVSIVSKCMLIKSCDCDMTDIRNCSCCKDCNMCLSTLYTECCSCVGMCPAPDPEEGLHLTSTIEELKAPIPELFDVLTEEKDKEMRWTTYTYPAHYDALYFKPGHGMLDVNFGAAEKDHNRKSIIQQGKKDDNCTVAFMSDCLSLKRCKMSCQSMGASRYRWFHEHGCCQCIGSACINYGLNKPKCRVCPDEEGDDEGEENVKEVVKEENIIEELVDKEAVIKKFGGKHEDDNEDEIIEDEIDEFDIKRV